MNWCSKPRERPKLDTLDICCGADRREHTVTIDVPEVAKQKLVISTDNMFTIGSVCIDRRGFHWKAPGGEVQGAASSRDNAVTLPWMASGGPEPGDEWRRGSRNYLEAKRGLRESGKLSFGGFALPNLSELTTLTSTRNYSRSVRLEDLVKIKAASECLGKGVSGTVWKVRDKSVDETLALKEMAMDTMDEVKNQTLVDEMRIMLELDHPSIVACHGVFYELGLFKIVMEFCDAGSLLDVMRIGNHTIPVAPLAGMMAQVLEAMSYLHTVMRVIHRDVKPGNLLLTRQGHCKLADFGVCSKPRDSRDSMCATWVGTVTYMSPERLKGNSYSFNADVWALGVIVVEATLGRYPYLADHTDKVDAGEFGEGGARKDKFEFWDLLYSLDDPSSPCATKKLPHDTDKNLVSFAQYVLDKDQETRASSTEALNHPFIATPRSNSGQMLGVISAWINKTLQGPRGMDARKISDALGTLSLGRPPSVAVGVSGAGGAADGRPTAEGDRETRVHVSVQGERAATPVGSDKTAGTDTLLTQAAAAQDVKPALAPPSSSRSSTPAPAADASGGSATASPPASEALQATWKEATAPESSGSKTSKAPTTVHISPRTRGQLSSPRASPRGLTAVRG